MSGTNKAANPEAQADYRTALAEIELLFEAVPRTLAGDRLEIVVTLVEVYEKRHFPIEPPEPNAVGPWPVAPQHTQAAA